MYSYDFVRTRGKDKTTRRRPQKIDRTLTVSSISDITARMFRHFVSMVFGLKTTDSTKEIKYRFIAKKENLSSSNQKTSNPLVS
jgi:hypothetical protein